MNRVLQRNSKKQNGENNRKHPMIVLAGQPNCGKSTIFNEVAGYRSMTSNFPGATVNYTESHVRIGKRVFDLVDLPGTYSLTSLDESEQETQRFLLTRGIDVVINVVDASLLCRSLELTLQLMDLEIPMVLCLNMMDEAERKGQRIDPGLLSERFGIPVIPVIASKGKGIGELFKAAVASASKGKKARHIRGNRDVELVIAKMNRFFKEHLPGKPEFPVHLLTTKLLENDPYFIQWFRLNAPSLQKQVERYRRELTRTHGHSSDRVIAAERHGLSMSLFEEVCRVGKPRSSFKDRVDFVLLHPFWGTLSLIAVLVLFFNIVFRVGGWIETPLLSFFASLHEKILLSLGEGSALGIILGHGLQGIGGGVALVLPYLFPFLFGLALLEDVGYLPRVAFLLDGLMHRIGLHGKAIIPAVLGYGCNVPAVMGTRILESRRDRFIASVIAVMVPCAARMTIIMGLVGYTLGATAALAIYLVNLVVIGLTGMILSRIMPEVSPGLVMEIPAYQAPRLKVTLLKTWMRLKEFIVIAWPLLILGSIVLGLVEHLRLTPLINAGLRPLTSLLGLPREVGIPLIFGVLRKELSMLMLFQALGTQDIPSVLSHAQILVFTVFVVFYIPCMGTLGVLGKQVGWRGMWAILGFTFFLALLLAMATRGLAGFIL